MKRIIILLLVLLPMMGVEMMGQMAQPTQKNEVQTKKNTKKQQVLFYVDIHCQGCCDKIMKNIAFEKGVKDIVCDVRSKTVLITYDETKTNVETLQKAFEKIGKPASLSPTCSHPCLQSSCPSKP